jgi:uncharacterized protein
MNIIEQKNVLGESLVTCSMDPLTGFTRTGCCETGPEDVGSHTVCIIATKDFLKFSANIGNDLSTPVPAFGFKGLKQGDRWCLCASRWQQAFEAGNAPKVVLTATHERCLEDINIDALKAHAIDLN